MRLLRDAICFICEFVEKSRYTCSNESWAYYEHMSPSVSFIVCSITKKIQADNRPR